MSAASLRRALQRKVGAQLLAHSSKGGKAVIERPASRLLSCRPRVSHRNDLRNVPANSLALGVYECREVQNHPLAAYAVVHGADG